MRDDRRMVATSPTSSTSSSSSSSVAPFSPSFHVQVEHLDGSLWSPCAALRHIRPLLHTDFFCMQADLITNIPLHHLADIHRSRDASVTALLLDTSKAKAREAAAAQVKRKKDDDDEDHDTHYIGLAADSSSSPSTSLLPPLSASPSSRILYYKSSLDIDDGMLGVHKALLRRCQRLSMHSSLKDAHLYLFAHWILNVVEEKRMMASIQSDLVPYLVKSQHRPAMRSLREPRRGDDEALALAMSHSAPRRDRDEVYRCYVYVADDSAYCKRATSTRAFREMNTQLSATEDDDLLALLATENHAAPLSKHFPRAQLAQSFIGVGVTLPADTPVTVRKTVMGRGVRVGAGVKINGSIVMEGVVIEDNVVMTDSVVSDGCVIGRGSSVVNCKVGPRYVIPPSSEHKNEVLCHERSS